MSRVTADRSIPPSRYGPNRCGTSLLRHEPVRQEQPARREPEPAYVGGGRAAPARPSRGDITAAPPAPMRGDITGAPPRRPEQPPQGQNGGNGRNGGWLGDLLSRASREDSPPIAPPGPRESARGEERPQQQRDNVESLESLAVDVARMIDHEAAADLWERYKRGERGMFSRRLYTAPAKRRSTRSGASTAPIRNSGRPSSNTSTSSNGCSTTSPAAIAVLPWCATI